MSTKHPALYILAALFFIAALFAAGYAVRHTVSSFLLAFVLAYLLDPFVVMLEKRKIRRVSGIAILYVTVGIVAIFCVAYLIPFLTLKWESLLSDLPRYVQKGKALLTEGKYQPLYANEEWSWLMERVADGLDTVMSKLGSGMYAAAGRVAFNLLNILLAPILVFFMLYYKHDVITGMTNWIPVTQRETVLELGREINASVGGYIRGQMIVSLIVAILSTVALLYLDVDYPVLNGIFAGLASILPFIGVFLAMIPPLFFAYVKFQSGLALLKVIGAFSVIYFMEGYLVKPVVFKKSMDLNPLATIIVVMAFGELMGFWGILLAIPIAAALKITTTYLRHGSFSHKD